MTPQPCRYCGELVALDEEGQLFATHPGNKAPWTCLPSPALRHALPVSAPLTDRWTSLRDQITRDAATEQELADGYSDMGAEDSANHHWGRAETLREVLATMDRMEAGQ